MGKSYYDALRSVNENLRSYLKYEFTTVNAANGRRYAGMRGKPLGKLVTRTLASGNGWQARDVVCSSGPQDRPFEEQHTSVSIAVVLEGTFQYRSRHATEVMTPGSLLVANYGQCFECRHEHGVGDRCAAFHYSPEFFEETSIRRQFPMHRIPPLKALAPWVVKAKLAVESPGDIEFDELALGLADAVAGSLEPASKANGAPTVSDERRISAVLRLIEGNLSEELHLARLAEAAKMSEFHFLRVFRQVAGITPHQYVLRARLREAACALRASSKPVLDVALSAGFGDVSNFNHSFRAEFGTTPLRFRRSG